MVDFAADDALAEFVEELVLNGSLDGSCTKLRVETSTGDETDGIVGDLERDAVLTDHLDDLIDLQTDNLLDLCLVEGREGDDVVDSVEELRTEDAAELVALGIAGHDDDGVLEVDHTSLVVGQTTVVEHLQEGVEHVGMSLLNLVEEHDAVRFVEAHR